MIIVYLTFKQVFNFIIEDRNSIKLGGFSWYNINVGLNYNSYGSWNQKDWDRVLNNVNYYSQQNVNNPALMAQLDEKKLISDKIKQIKNPITFF